MARFLLSDEQWEFIENVFSPAAPTGRPRRDPRQVLNGILWILRTGAPWRDVPEEFGTWKTCWQMFDRWTSDGTLDLLLTRLQGSFIDLQKLDQQRWCIDGTIVRAARCAAGGGKKGSEEPADHDGAELRFSVDENQPPLVWPAALAGDKGYRADWIDTYLLERHITPIIPSKENEDRPFGPLRLIGMLTGNATSLND